MLPWRWKQQVPRNVDTYVQNWTMSLYRSCSFWEWVFFRTELLWLLCNWNSLRCSSTRVPRYVYDDVLYKNTLRQINRDNSVGVSTGCMLDGPSSNPGKKKWFFSVPQRLDPFWGPLSVYTVVTWGSSTEGKAAELLSIYWKGSEWWNYTSISSYVSMALS
jgi:hypothetical protein